MKKKLFKNKLLSVILTCILFLLAFQNSQAFSTNNKSIENSGLTSNLPNNNIYTLKTNLLLTPIGPPNAAPQSFCGSTTVASLVATGNSGFSILWYNVATGGMALASTDAITTSGTFYASQTNGTSESARTSVEITITPTVVTTVNACGYYYWNESEQTYVNSGTYTFGSGCNLKTLVLTVESNNVVETAYDACGSYFWNVTGITYTTSGTYTYGSGCNLKTLNLTIRPNNTSQLSASACSSYLWSESGDTYTTSGTYTSGSGCDLKTLILTIAADNPSGITIRSCEPYLWPVTGLTYSMSGFYTGGPCNTLFLDLTVLPDNTSTTTISACGSYLWSENGQTYTDSGFYSVGPFCSEKTLILTITPDNTATTTQSACGSYFWNQSEQTYTESGTYTFGSGCNLKTLVLTITPDNTATTTQSACGSYFWNQPEQTYTESGTYTFGSGCNLKTLVLTITPSSVNTATASACGTYTWANNNQTYTTSGVYTGNTTNCITEKLDLTITTYVNTVALNGGTLTANQANASYQWIDCADNSPISGATNQTFQPLQSGNYGVIIGDSSCNVTSNCTEISVLANNQFDLNNSIEALPNPFNSEFSIKNKIAGTVVIFDLTGKIIKTEKLETGTTPFDFSQYSSGIYFVKFNDSNNNSKLFKMIKR